MSHNWELYNPPPLESPGQHPGTEHVNIFAAKCMNMRYEYSHRVRRVGYK